MRVSILLVAVVAWIGSASTNMNHAAEPLTLNAPLAEQQIVDFAELALAGLDREYPNKTGHVMVGPESAASPRQLHPVFFGCFDWHSAVHGHWMLVRLLKLYPAGAPANRIRAELDRRLTAEPLQIEASYFDQRDNQTFERMYGWAWALRLVAELHAWDDARGKVWRENLAPLERRLVELTKAYLPRLSHPVRTGVHPDSAFAFGQIHDYATTVGDRELQQLVARRGRDFYLADVDYPASYEPSGEDFFSAGLNEADFMRRILPGDEYAAWLDRFLPGLRLGHVGQLLVPVAVADVTDGKLVHLAGLNLSRAWTLQGIASALNQDDPRVTVLRDAAARHAEAGYRYVFSGHYEGEHWLATFAVYLRTGVGISRR